MKVNPRLPCIRLLVSIMTLMFSIHLCCSQTYLAPVAGIALSRQLGTRIKTSNMVGYVIGVNVERKIGKDAFVSLTPELIIKGFHLPHERFSNDSLDSKVTVSLSYLELPVLYRFI